VIVCAIMRKLVHLIYGILKSGKKYDPNYKPALAWQERYLQVLKLVSRENRWLPLEELNRFAVVDTEDLPLWGNPRIKNYW